jgi:class 3 adenylate cyclase
VRRLDADVLTFLIADVRGFTRFTQEQGDEAASRLARQFAAIVRAALPDLGGELVEIRGDEALSVFGSARQALRAAVELQRRFRDRSPEEPFPLGVGMGLDAGEAVPTDGGYRGKALNLAARLCALAGPGQILATESVVHLAHRVEGLNFVPRRAVRLKGVEDPVRLVEVRPVEELPPVPSPPRPPARRRRKLLLLAAVLAVAAAGLGILALAGVFDQAPEQAPPRAAPSIAGLYRIDLASNRVVQTIALNPDKSVDQVRVADGSIWVGGLLKGVPNLLRVDPRTGRATTIPEGGAPFALGNGKIFVYGGTPGNRTNYATVIDAANPTALPNVIELQPFHSSQAPGPLEFGLGSLWAWEYGANGCCDGKVLWRVNPETHRVVGRWDNPLGSSVYQWAPEGFAVGPEGVWRVAVDDLVRIYPSPLRVKGVLADEVAEGNSSVWAVSTASDLKEINPFTGTIAWTHHFNAEIDSIVVGQGSVWLADRPHRTITRVDIATHHIFKPVHLKSTPAAMAVGPDGLWVGFPRGDFPL